MLTVIPMTGRTLGPPAILIGQERLLHEVVNGPPQLELALLDDQMDAVREHHDDRLALEVDPERGPGEAEVPDALRREVPARARRAGRPRVPAESPGRLLGGDVLGQEAPQPVPRQQ